MTPWATDLSIASSSFFHFWYYADFINFFGVATWTLSHGEWAARIAAFCGSQAMAFTHCYLDQYV
jgi:hypothetical protein